MTHCPHCQHNTIRQVGQSIDCINPDCPAYTLTLPPEQFMGLTAADFASYKAGQDKSILAQMDMAQKLDEAKWAEFEQVLEARKAARDPQAKTFG